MDLGNLSRPTKAGWVPRSLEWSVGGTACAPKHQGTGDKLYQRDIVESGQQSSEDEEGRGRQECGWDMGDRRTGHAEVKVSVFLALWRGKAQVRGDNGDYVSARDSAGTRPCFASRMFKLSGLDLWVHNRPSANPASKGSVLWKWRERFLKPSWESWD